MAVEVAGSEFLWPPSVSIMVYGWWECTLLAAIARSRRDWRWMVWAVRRSVKSVRGERRSMSRGEGRGVSLPVRGGGEVGGAWGT